MFFSGFDAFAIIYSPNFLPIQCGGHFVSFTHWFSIYATPSVIIRGGSYTKINKIVTVPKLARQKLYLWDPIQYTHTSQVQRNKGQYLVYRDGCCHVPSHTDLYGKAE